MMMKAAKLGWAGSGAGQEQAGSTLGASKEQSNSMEEARVGQEQAGSTLGAGKEQSNSMEEARVGQED